MKPYFERDNDLPLILPTGIAPYFLSHDGRIVIYHGDARDVLPSLAPSDIDLVLTDPPYGVNEQTRRRTREAGKRRDGLHAGALKNRDWPAVFGDDSPFDPQPLLVFRRAILWGGNHYADRLPPSAAWLVWDKRAHTASDDNADCELAWSNLKGPVRRFVHLWRGVCRASETGKAPLHPTQKPVALMRWCLDRARLEPGSLILDPYMGSGPVAEACRMEGHRYIGIEIEERYCEIAARRLDQLVLPLEAV